MELTFFRAIILGIVQGVTELLPISSSAHLYIIPWMLNWGEIGDFDVALHFGTLLAIVLFFYRDWKNLLKGGYELYKNKKPNFEGRMLTFIIIATIPGGIAGYILDKYFSDILTNPEIIGIALIFMGILLYFVDKNAQNKVKFKEMTFGQTFLIGLSQALAFIPGVSRSGITMMTARAMGVTREASARYSFLLATPIVLAATLFKIKDFQFSFAFFAGVLTSFITGVFVIKFLLNYLKKGSFKAFAVYRIIVGIIVLCVYLARM